MKRYWLKIVMAILVPLFCACTSNKKETTEDTNLYRIMVGDKYGFMNENGEIVIDPKFDNAYFFSDGLCVVKSGDLIGYIDTTGDIVIQIDNAEAIFTFSEGMARVIIGGKAGFIDTTGTIVISPQFSAKHNDFFSKGYAIVHNLDGKEGVIDKTGRFIVYPNYLNISIEDSVGFVVEDTNQHYGIIGFQGNILSPCIYDAIWNFCDGLAMVRTVNNKYGCIKVCGDLLIDTIYEDGDISIISHELIRLSKNGKYGFLDHDANIAIDFTYDFATSFSNGRAFVGYFDKDTTIFMINKSGEKICQIEPDRTCSMKIKSFNDDFYLDNFIDGYAIFSGTSYLNNIEIDMAGVIDTNGNIIISPKYKDINYLGKGLFLVENSIYKRGIVDSFDSFVIQPVYDKIEKLSNGYFVVQNDRKKGIVDSVGNIIVPIRFSDIVDAIYGKPSSLFICYEQIDGIYLTTYFDKTGKTVWQDIPPSKKYQPNHFSKEDWLDYFKSNIVSLDPIEGLYFFEVNFSFYVNRFNPQNNGVADNHFATGIMAIVKDNEKDRYVTYLVNNEGNVNKDKLGSDAYKMYFNKLGDPKKYMVEYNDKYSQLSLDNPYQFELFVDKRSQDIFDFYERYAFVKEYPTMSDNKQERQPEWSGTGFAIADGLIATNYHVVNGVNNISIKGVEGDMETTYNGYVLASDKNHDIAIIKIVDKKFKGFGKIPYCVGKTVSDVGEDVFALGFPLTTTMGNEVKLTNGIISSTSGFQGDVSMYQISVPLQPGNSGGPLFDDDGNIVGIVTAKHADAENANYAVKINYLASLISNKNLDIKLADNNKIKGKSLKKKVKAVKNFVYLIECSN